MKKSHAIILAGLCAIGLLTGFVARRISAGSPPAARSLAAAPAGEKSRDISPSTRPVKSALPETISLRSTDAVESLLELDPEINYARIALWMTTAGEQEIATYWAGYKGGKRTVDVTDLVFLSWTRRNPQAAVAAVAGTDDERYVWWSWAANDSLAALAAAKASGKRVALEQVACGIGDFNPDWLRKNLHEIPEEFRDDALGRMRNWPDSQNPMESLNFMKENGMGFDQETFKSLVRKDPWAALDWLKENPRAGRQMYSSENETMASFVSILSQERPEDLERIAAQTSPGDAKRQMEQALFDRLLETDPAAALEKAKQVEAPLVAAQRMAKVGLSMLATDPEKAFEIAGEILEANPEQIDIRNVIQYPGGSTWSGEGGPATELMNALFSKDRDQVLKLMAENSGDQKTPEILSEYSAKWAESDLLGFTGWANQQTGKLHAVAAQQIGNKLAAQGSYAEAIEWAGNGPLPPEQAYSNILYQWSRTDATAAGAWLENSNLTAEQKDRYRSFLKSFPR